MVMSAYALSDALSIAFSDKYSFKQRLAAGFFAASQLATWIVSATFARGHFPTGSSPSSTQSGALAGGPKLIMRVPQGKQFTQVVGPQQSKPGSWVTTVEFATEELARSKLALLSVHKSKVYGNATVKVDAPSVSAEIGIVGPQENFPGGAIQFMFRDPVSGKPSNSGLIFTTDPVVPMQ